MSKKKNPANCRLQIGDRVQYAYGRPDRVGTHIQRMTGGASFVVRWDGETYDSYYYRYELLWIDPGPTEPEPYEAWFVA